MLPQGETDQSRNGDWKNNNITMFMFLLETSHIYVKKDGFKLLTSLSGFDIIE